jgi:hypothetical protein
MTQTMRGVLHLHSRFSDGEETLDCVADTFKDLGMDFIMVSDHAEVFDESRMQQYVARCSALSTEEFLVIPGLEFALKGGSIHILGYGINSRVYFSKMEHLVDGIHRAGGIAVLAHPPEGSINMIDSVKGELDGIEVWNVRYDGIVAPRTESFQLLGWVQKSNPKAVAYCGVDFHKMKQARHPVYVELEAERLERREIMNTLRAGSFTIRGRNLAVPSSGKLTFVQQLVIAVKQPLRSWVGLG